MGLGCCDKGCGLRGARPRHVLFAGTKAADCKQAAHGVIVVSNKEDSHIVYYATVACPVLQDLDGIMEQAGAKYLNHNTSFPYLSCPLNIKAA